MEAPTVLVVEDEPSLADILRITLEFHGFRVLRAATGARAVEMARKHRPDLLLLDVMLPDGNGWQVCRTVRSEREDVPVVFLTARDAPADIVGGLALGGDDYITKPFNIDEVVARVRAVLRRVRLQSPPPAVLRHGDVEMDEATYTVRRAGTPVDLTPTEYALLRYLMLNAGRVVTKEEILREVWKYGFSGETTVVETYVGYLRRKLDPLGTPLIVTRRGRGYQLRATE
ncbi:response regulator transcription factor [Actinomadura madurae]|uniref:response regulator transcription factor n=1 Tax=Actinomadura madurae TaxID=1993 RepID=UPI001FD28C52|nr:response regulator transcription factor [Actinomadura madurae]MCP9964365.1 response regulator transcription factor [Actinomadura madurae]URN03993.1 response regulator transcription factor [Actinomadura madurae]